MKVVILCGGLGTRLREETEYRPKPMVPVGNQPILWHIMKLYAAAGHKEFILCLGYKGEVIKEYFRNYHWSTSDVTIRLGALPEIQYHNTHDEEDWTVTLLDTGATTQTGGRLKRALPHIQDDTFLLTYGDGLTDSDINASIDFHRAHRPIITVTAVQPAGRFGDLTLEGIQITSFKEKPEQQTAFINGGFFVVDKRIGSYIASDDTVLESDPMNRLAAEGQICAYQHPGFWQCMDTFREQQLLTGMWQSGKALEKMVNAADSFRFSCRACGSGDGELVLDLGRQPLANNLPRAEDLDKPEPRFPLRLAVCHRCWLLQIVDLVPPTELFSEYLYFSSFSDAMLRHARAAADQHAAEFGLGVDSFVVEIASNDGYLLKNFVARGVPCLGIEPAANIATVARENGIDTRVEFFGQQCAQALVAEGKAADLILGNNVFAHAPDTNDFVAGLRTLLKPGGRVALEFPYAGDFVENCEFDTIYHEHVFYFYLIPLLELFAKHGLEIFHVERLPIHGGSLRLYAGRAGEQAVRPTVAALREEEERHGVRTGAFYRDFFARADTIRRDLLALLADLQRRGKRVAAYGASAKGSTLLNFVNPPDPGMFEFMADRSTYKQGRYSPGLHVPVVAAEELLARQPDYTLLLTWNFADEILAQQAEYRARGGKFIVPIPKVKVL